MSKGNLQTTWTNVQRSKTSPHKRRRKRRQFPVGLRRRMLRRAPLIRELQLYGRQQGLHPDRFLIAWAWSLADDDPSPVASLVDYAAVIGRSLADDEAMAVLAEAESLEPQRGGYALAVWLGIPSAIARRYRLKTISGCDVAEQPLPSPSPHKHRASGLGKRAIRAGAIPSLADEHGN
jgi:hypothetical protein